MMKPVKIAENKPAYGYSISDSGLWKHRGKMRTYKDQKTVDVIGVLVEYSFVLAFISGFHFVPANGGLKTS